ncbi:CoA transferase subunit A [Bacillus sp. FJAT-45037]|uniref:CoA transferase subunit A n=1 Tax=Bacillus sp. FJAT-45037 TaxID=2011007 RepID=UPI000C232279|nr:CoA transferase subunit A [Bacillus sp. FJAT-45037]
MDEKRSLNKVGTLKQAMSVIHDGSTVMFGGFGGVGNPPTIIKGMLEKGVKELTLIGNDSAFPHIGIGQIIKNKQAKKLIASHIGSNPVTGQLMVDGELEVEFSPQGTLAERIRAGGVGIPAFLTDVGLGSVIEEGKQKVRLDNKDYLLETALRADVSIIFAKKADTFGNLIYETSARNTNPLVAMAGAFTIVEVEEIVELGEIHPAQVMTPGIFVDLVIQSEGVDWQWVWE